MLEVPKTGRVKSLILSGNFNKLIIYTCTGVAVSVFLILALLSFIGIIEFGSTADFIIFATVSYTHLTLPTN